MGRNIEDFIANVKRKLEDLESSKNRIEAELNIISAIADIMNETGVKIPVKDFEIYSITENTPVKHIDEALRNDVIKALCGVLGGLLDVKIEDCKCVDEVIDRVIGNYGQSYDSRLRSLSKYGRYKGLLGNYVRNCMSGDVCEFLEYLLEGEVEKVLGNLFREFDILRDKMREFGIDTGKLVNCFIRPCKTEELVAEMRKVSSALSKLIFMSKVLDKLSVDYQGSVESKSLWMSKVSNLVRELSNVSKVIEETKANLKGMLEGNDVYREDCISLISGECGKALDNINDSLSRIRSTMSTISAMINLAKKQKADVNDIEKPAKSIINCVDYLSELIKADTGIPTGGSQCQDINKHVGRLMMRDRDLSKVIEEGLSDSEREVLSKILEVLGTTGQVSIKELAERLSEQELSTLNELCKRGILTCVVSI